MTEEKEATFYQLPAVMAVPHRPEGEVNPLTSVEPESVEQWGREMYSAVDGLLDWSKEMHSAIYDNYIPQTDRIENMNMVGETLDERPDAIGSRRYFYHRPERNLYMDVRYGGENFWDLVFSPDAIDYSLDTTDFDKILSAADDTVQAAMDTLDDHIHEAWEIETDTGNFNGLLNTLDDEVQHALDTIDNLQIADFPDEANYLLADGTRELTGEWGLGNVYGITEVDHFDFNLTPTSGGQEGRLHWHEDDGTLSLGMPGGNVELQIGQEMLVRCRNTTGVTILNGSPVYADGATGNRPLIKLADASNVLKSYVVGVATEDIDHNSNGFVATRGLVRDVNTGGMAVGSQIYLSATVPGTFTNTIATAPDMKAFLGIVIASHASSGVIGVRPTVIPRLNFLSDVLYGIPSDGDFLRWRVANSRFEYDNPTITYKQIVPLDTYIDVKERLTEWNVHGGIHSLVTGQPLNSTPTDIAFTAGRGKLFIVVNAGTDYDGSITVTGTSVDRDDGTQTPADTDTITVDALTTDASDTDANGNTRHSFTGGYVTSKWFTGSVTLSTTDLTLTDVDVYLVAFEQCNDEPNCEILTMDFAGVPTNSSAWLDVYAYLLEVTGDKCDISRIVDGHIPASEISANKWYRGRRGNIAATFDGTTDGFWLDFFPGPLANNYWEDINIKVWIEVTKTATLN